MDDEKKDLVDDEKKIYIANQVNNSQNYQEKVLFGSTLSDRRHKVVSVKDKRPIIQCIGRVKSDWGKNIYGKKVYGYGTGTAFRYDTNDSNVYVITCAHNIVEEDENKAKKAINVWFERRKTFQYNESALIKTHKCDSYEYHKGYSFKDQCPNDLAILVFQDDGFYKNVFRNHQKDIIQLFTTNLITKHFILMYEIYGYPFNDDKHSKVIDGELWGMENKSYSIVNDI
eukprot:375914_1